MQQIANRTAKIIAQTLDYYAVQDWIRGLIGAKDVRQLWNDIQRKSTLFQMSD